MSANPAEADEDPLIGRVVQGRFKVNRRLAAGGMGVVYEAEQVPLGRKVALKILEVSKTPRADASFEERFFLEASAAAKLAHPNTIVVHDYGSTDDGLCFIAMEYLDGGTLSHRLKKTGPLPPTEAIHVGLQIASSLREAHEQGLVHRDLKPGNVMFAPRGGDPNFVKVLDFGLVKVLDQGKDALQLTQSGVMMGSPRYMAPEQVKAQPCDARTDIYSFGAVLYHALTGAPPFHAGSAFEAMQHHVYSPVPPMKQTWPGCPVGPKLEAVVARCLAKEQGHRFQSMEDVMGGLREAAAEAGGGLSGVGSYLGRSPTGSPDSSAFLANVPPPQFGETPSSPSNASNPGSGSQGVSSRIQSRQPTAEQTGVGTRNKTVRFDQMGPPAAPAAAPTAPEATPTPTAGPVAAPPASSSKLLLALMALIALLLAGGLVVAIVVLVPMGEAPQASAPEEIASPPPAAPPAPAPRPATAVPASPVTPAPAATAAMMHLDTDPTGATVRRRGSDLGDTPLDLRIPAGERWTIEITLEGYATREVTLQGGQRTLTLSLEPLEEEPVAAPVVRRPHAPVPRPQVRRLAPATNPTNPPVQRRRGTYAPDLDDPWAH